MSETTKISNILKGIPTEGKIVSIGERTREIGGFFFSSMKLITTLFIWNEIFGIEQSILFRGPPVGNVLSSLIDDFKDGKELCINGKVSYFLIYPIFGGEKIPRQLKKEFGSTIEKVVHLTGAIDWRQISEDDKEALVEFFRRFNLVFAESNNLQVLVDGKIRYIIHTPKDHTYASIVLQQTE